MHRCLKKQIFSAPQLNINKMDYTYAQMKEMQEQAFERVREMQKRADLAARQAMQDINGKNEKCDEKKDSAPRSFNSSPVKRVPDEPKRYSMPVEFPDRGSLRSVEKKEQNDNFLNKLLNFNENDRESALLVTLMMLLNAENTDRELLFALMYILNG